MFTLKIESGFLENTLVFRAHFVSLGFRFAILAEKGALAGHVGSVDIAAMKTHTADFECFFYWRFFC